MRAIAMNDADSQHPSVEMETEAGKFRGVWRGASPISLGDAVDIELDVAAPRSSSDFVFDPRESQPQGVIRGVVQTVFEDGVVVLQVGSSALQIELDHGRFEEDVIGRTVELVVEDLEFYPTGV